MESFVLMTKLKNFLFNVLNVLGKVLMHLFQVGVLSDEFLLASVFLLDAVVWNLCGFLRRKSVLLASFAFNILQ